ncbi:MAG: DUF5606 domain-containing protein [Paramuribaculum sp.]|nr:DUF5606 domain-containing protein [Paramuribaculum sp.]
MIRDILSISGRQGLFRLVSQGKNMLIVESLLDGRRSPAYAHDKVMALADISIYTLNGDKLLADVLEEVKTKAGGEKIDIKAIGSDQNLRDYFGEILPDFDSDRVYTADIRKLLTWYNQLIGAGVTEFKDPEPKAETEENATEE